MTPSARLAAMIELVERITASRVPMDTTIGDYMRPRRYIGAKDRADIAARVYAIARAWLRLDWWLQHLGSDGAARDRVLVALALVEKLPVPHIQDLCTGGKYAAEPLTDDEVEALKDLQGKALSAPDMPSYTAVECPEDAAETLQTLFGDAFATEMEAMLEPATLDLRVNVKLASVEKVAALLADDGVPTKPTPYSPWGLRVDGKAYLSKTRAFTKGFIDIQDEGSQLIAYLCDAKPGMQVLDYCAGAGGKTLALANAMNVKGRIVAMDTEAARLAKAKERFRRAFVTDIIEIRPLSDEQHRKWFKRQKGTFDAVLLDVPCSGSGTWRRNPDMRWRHYGPSMPELLETQAAILDKASVAVKPGGRLVYATCSLYPQENEDQVNRFLAANPDFKLVPVQKAWPSGTQCPCKGDMMRLSPSATGTDGFFAAVMQRGES